MSSIKKIAVALICLFIAGTASIQAQTPAPASATQQKTEISKDELNKFADAFQQVQMENQKAQQKMMSVIKEEGMEVKRFNEIQQGQLNPQKEVEATEEELTQHKAVVAELEKLQPAIQSKMETIITDSGLTVERYQQVAMQLQNDKNLQQRLQSVLVKQKAPNSEG